MKNVQQVFVGDDANAVAGTAVGAIAAGDFSILDGGVNTTVANISAATADFFHFAVGTGGDTVVSDSFPSAVTRTSSVAAYNAAVDKGITIDLGSVSCETEYMLKIRFEGEAIAKAYGYNDLIKTFSYITECCDPCSTDCPSGSCLDLAWGLWKAIDADEENLIVPVLITTAGWGGIGAGNPIANQADYEAYLTYVTVTDPKTYDEICADLTFSINGNTSSAKDLVCGQDPMQLSQTVVDFHIGLLGGFECNGSSQTVIQALEYAVGEPYQVANLARWAEGYKREFGVYRTPFPYDTFVSNGVIDPTGTYDIVTISLMTVDPSASTLNPSINNHEIIVAVTAGNAANVTALIA